MRCRYVSQGTHREHAAAGVVAAAPPPPVAVTRAVQEPPRPSDTRRKRQKGAADRPDRDIDDPVHHSRTTPVPAPSRAIREQRLVGTRVDRPPVGVRRTDVDTGVAAWTVTNDDRRR